MKKFIYLFIAIIGLAFTACEPMDEIHEDIDAEIANRPIEGSVEDYVLTAEDYSFLGFPDEQTEFDSEDDARELIPVLLDDQYPVWGDGSLVNATFNVYDPIRIEDYSLGTQDYEAIGLSENYFSGFGDIQDFLEFQYPQAQNGDYISLTYNTLADEESYMFSDEDFDIVGEELGDDYPQPASSAAQYGNFERRETNNAYWSNEMILEAINTVLSENIDGVEGQKYNVSYDIYNGSAGTESMAVQFNGNAYIAVGGTAYEFTNDDYDLVGTAFGETYPGPAGNAAQYNSFDIQESSNNFWSMEMILEAINAVLEENHPDAVEGDKFEVSYAVYSGGVSSAIQNVVLENGTYVIDEEAAVSTIEETAVFVYTNGSWDTPFTLESEDYTEMEQSFPNFDDEDEAIYKIGIFLESEFPYAEEGDFVSVAYDFYSGSTTTEYANYIFESGEWNYIPSVVEQSLQFGHDGNTWVPDNTIRYQLTDADFEYISSEFEDEYVDPAWSAGNYGNFDRREGNVNYWSNDMILEALNAFLNNHDPNAEEGQQYVITYDIYNGTNTTESMRVVKEDGEWIMNE